MLGSSYGISAHYSSWATPARNITPDKLKAAERQAIEEPCLEALTGFLEVLEPSHAIGVGKFAEKKAAKAVKQLGRTDIVVGSILHPSPASPMANRGWAPQAVRQLEQLGLL